MKRFTLFAVVFLFVGIFSANAQNVDPADGFIEEAGRPAPARNADPAVGFIETEQPASAYDSDPAAGFIAGGGGRPIYALDPKKLNFGISLNLAGFIPWAGNGLSLSADFTKGRFNSIIDIHSGFGILRSMMYDWNGSHFFGVSSNFHYFHPGRIGGFYVGVMLEYSFGWCEIYDYEERGHGGYDDEGNYYSGMKYDPSHRFGLAGSIGYKFVTSSGVYFRTGFTGGWSFGKGAGLIARPDLSIGYNFKIKTQ